MFVHPAQIAKIINRQREVLKARLIVDQHDEIGVMTLSCEIRDVDATASGPSALTAKIAQTIEAVCKLKGEVGFPEPGNLPIDGKVIEDIRDHD